MRQSANERHTTSQESAETTKRYTRSKNRYDGIQGLIDEARKLFDKAQRAFGPLLRPERNIHFRRDLARADDCPKDIDWLILKLDERMEEWRCPDFETGGSFVGCFR
jgi:hypothetical protein